MKFKIVTTSLNNHMMQAGGLAIPECTAATVAGTMRRLERTEKLDVTWTPGDCLSFAYANPGLSIQTLFDRMAATVKAVK